MFYGCTLVIIISVCHLFCSRDHMGAIYLIASLAVRVSYQRCDPEVVL